VRGELRVPLPPQAVVDAAIFSREVVVEVVGTIF